MAAGEALTGGELLTLLEQRTAESAEILRAAAVETARKTFGNRVYLRGLIEFTNYCKNDCYYCGIRCSNQKAERYRLTPEVILACCDAGYDLGFRTFVLQGGEDSWWTDDKLCSLIAAIKQNHPDCALTLSIGERSRDSYAALKQAGADRYLLRHETANACHYRRLHPPALKLENRIRCLYDLKDLGYQVGAGMMVGAPGQTLANLVEDLQFLQKLQPHMVGMGPFLRHRDTPFANEPDGSAELTLYLLSMVRLLLPKVLLPATTALGTVLEGGRERGILHGANVVMPNLSPADVRSKYLLYHDKLATGAESANGLAQLRRNLKAIGYEAVVARGDAPTL
ncbi:[FeFe] hydrogenase H-cluster radical SAM maturase HydE [Butyricicoccus pullicaecorum]|uniref:[FeFe] hydrogenase H-cluster radical SAM maturase HydE n=2 Tax=Butyricicoccus pullicaecorum TaxID=501571 RepID=A0A1Y4LQ06_9FIRM|nr:[FeFe] hydrogenase H-cluster radical SAM maturase HydE [Butyricicoccus pullicaecorum]